ncbi:MAG: hypothetical protein ABSC13_08535 [Dehalococcoidia bacterium]|jgi:hypothetical protein
MKRWHWMSLALLGGMAAVALIAVPRFTGGTPRVAAQEAPSLFLDMQQPGADPFSPSNPPCITPHATRTTVVGDTYEVAICLDNAPSAPAAFNFDLLYNDQLNTCVTSANTNLDSNPDANTGNTTFSSTSLGSGFDCTGVGSAPPKCDTNPSPGSGAGDAYLGCFQASGSPTLPTGQDVASPLAVVTFQAVAGGTDTLTLVNGVASGADTLSYLSCPELGSCGTASDVKSGNTPVPQPTATPTAGPTATPSCGLEDQPTCAPTPTLTPTPKAHSPTPTATVTGTATTAAEVPPPPPAAPPPSGGAGPIVSPPNTGGGSDSAPWGMGIAWIIAFAAAVTLAGGTFYLRRARMRR